MAAVKADELVFEITKLNRLLRCSSDVLNVSPEAGSMGRTRTSCPFSLGYQWGHRALANVRRRTGKRRTAESAECAKHYAHSKVLDIHDGELLPTLENRKTICRIIRQWNADIVISHRPWDYHPDHRYTGILVQDAAFMVTVPFFCPDVPHLKKNPVFLYSSDGFTKPYPFDPDIVVSLDSIFPKKVEALTALVSQAFEGGAGGSPERMALVPPASDPKHDTNGYINVGADGKETKRTNSVNNSFVWQLETR